LIAGWTILLESHFNHVQVPALAPIDASP
jgi:hypothetical protein